MHHPPNAQALRNGTRDAIRLQSLREQGKFRSKHVCNYNVQCSRWTQAHSEKRHRERFDSANQSVGNHSFSLVPVDGL